MDKKLFRSIVLLLLVAALFSLAVLNINSVISIIKLLGSVIAPVFAGVLIALFLDRPYGLFRRMFLRIFKKAKHKYKLSAGLGVALTYIVLLSFIAVFLITVIPEVTDSVTTLVDNIGSYVKNIQNTLNDFIAKYDYLKDNFTPVDFSEWGTWLTTLVKKIIEVIDNRLPEIFNITKSIAGGVTNTILSLIISVYIMLGRNHLKWQAKKTIYAIFPTTTADRIREIAKLTARTLSGYISGRVIDSIIVGLLCYVFMKIFGFEYAALISFIIGVTNIIPMLGPFIGAIPSAFLLLLVNPVHCFWFIVFVLILQQVDSNLIDPKISGEYTGLPTLWVLVSITVGGGLFGLIGFILSVPLCAVLYTLIKRHVAKLSENKGISLNDEPEKDPPSTGLSLKKFKRCFKGKQNKTEGKK